MKLRNKKTGKIIDITEDWGLSDTGNRIVLSCLNDNILYYKSLAELNDDWEDYTPQEPLIKDEKIRKAVRAWADANKIENYHENKVKVILANHKLKWINTSIEFNEIEAFDDLLDKETYTITELCGEEE